MKKKIEISQLSIDFNPTENEISIILNQLNLNGFDKSVLLPHDEHYISKAIERREFIALKYYDSTIGFTTYQHHGFQAEIEYKWILPEFRHNGLGIKFAMMIYEELLSQGIFFIKVHPATVNGLRVAESLCFSQKKPFDYYHYKFLKEGRPEANTSDTGYTIRLNHLKTFPLDNDLGCNPIILPITDEYVPFDILKDGEIIKSGDAGYYFGKQAENEITEYYICISEKFGSIRQRLRLP